MDTAALNQWAAKFVGEEEPDDAAAMDWYTESPAAAFVVLNKCAEEGCKVSLTMSKEGYSVTCDESVVKGKLDKLAEGIIQCCRECMGDGYDA